MSDGKLLFGTAHGVITPTMPVSLAGYFNVRMTTGVLDDLEVRALVLKKDGAAFLLLQFDLITVSELLYAELRKAIADLTEFGEENILMTATHTHTGPDFRPSCPVDASAYFDFLVKKASEVIHEAASNLREGELAYTLTEDRRFSFNRRYWMKDGSVLTNPGKLNPQIGRPEGETDFDIPIAALIQDGKVQVLLANIVNHTDTIGGTEVSADWAGFMRRTLEKQLGASSMVFPLIGCAGNINHFDVSTDRDQTCYAEAERIGTGYAQTVSMALKNLRPAGDFTMKNLFASAEAGGSDISEREIRAAEKTLKKYADVPDAAGSKISLTSEDLAKRSPVALKYFASSLLEIAKDRDMRRFRLTGLEMGSVVIASLPSEPFVEIGLEIRRRIFPDKLCLVLSHGNGTGHVRLGGGYIPNRWNYGCGGYETEPRSNPFERATAEKLIEAWRKAAAAAR